MVAKTQHAPTGASSNGTWPTLARGNEVTERRRVEATKDMHRFGRRLRERRLAAGLSQAQLAGKRYSHAFVSSLESGRRGVSKDAVDYFAQRLGVPVQELWGEIGPHWALQMAIDLREQGQHQEGRDLLVRTLENLQRDSEVHPRVLVTLYLELGWVDLAAGDPATARNHLSRCLELTGDDDMFLGERAEANAGLGELLEESNAEEALRRYKAATRLLMDLLGRSPRFSRLERARRLNSSTSATGGRLG